MKKTLSIAALFVTAVSLMLIMTSCAKKTSIAEQRDPLSQPQIVEEKMKAQEEAMQETIETASAEQTRQAVMEKTRKDKERNAFITKDVYFDFNKSVIRPNMVPLLIHKTDWLQKNPDMSVIIEGHCDERGTDAYNKALGDRRAESVKNFLVSLGISANRLNTVSYGEERPIAIGQNEASWAKNRRTQFVIN